MPLPGGRTPVIEDSFASEFLWLVLGQLVGEKGTIPAPLLTLPSHIAVQIIAEQVRHPAHGRRFHSTPPVLCSSGASTSCRGQSSAVSSGLARWGQHSIQDVCPPPDRVSCPWLRVGQQVEFVPPPATCFVFLLAMVTALLVATELMKRVFHARVVRAPPGNSLAATVTQPWDKHLAM